VKIGPDTTYSGTPNTWEEAFVAKVNPAGTALVYCGYIGGPTNDRGFGVAVDRLGNAYVTGVTASAMTACSDRSRYHREWGSGRLYRESAC
jgi:hypothetical protein